MSTSKAVLPERSGYLVLSFAVLLIVAAIGFLQLLGTEDQERLLAEGGFFENLTVVGYAACLILIGVCWPWSTTQARWYFPALIILFALRELDYDKSQFTVGLLKSRQYFGNLVSIPELVLSVVILIFILSVVASIFLKETRNFISGLIAGETSQLAIMASILLLLTSKSVDGLGRKLAGFNIEVSQSVEQFSYVFEEVGELGIPMMFAVAIVFGRSRGS
jgi:hypothetical protein